MKRFTKLDFLFPMTQKKINKLFFVCLLFGCTRHKMKSEIIFSSVVLSQFLLVVFFSSFFPGKRTSSSGTFPVNLNYPCFPINCPRSLSVRDVQVLLSQIFIKSFIYSRSGIQLLVLHLAGGFTFEQLVVVFRVSANA